MSTSRQQHRAAARRKINVGDMLVTHIARFIMSDGTAQFAWCVTDSVETPTAQSVEMYGPYLTAAEAQADANEYVQEQLGPQCKIEHGGTWDPAWNRSQ
jgi:hypothetical protein